MANKKEKNQPLRGGLEVENTRHDLRTAREPESSYIHVSRKPEISGNKAEWVKAAHERGVSFKTIIKRTGLKTATVLSLCGLDPSEERRLFEELEEYRTNLLNQKD